MSISEETTTTQTSFKVNPYYTGQKLFYVPVKMYVQNKLLSAVGFKTQRWLRVDLDRGTLAFHHNLTDINADEQISFDQIKSIDADFSKGKDEVYYLTIKGVDDAEFKFKFQNIREFYEVVNALRNTLRADQTALLGREEFTLSLDKKKEEISKPLPQYGNIKHVDILSDDEFKEYQPAQKVTTYGHTEGGSRADNLKYREECFLKKELELKEREAKLKMQEAMLQQREAELAAREEAAKLFENKY